MIQRHLCLGLLLACAAMLPVAYGAPADTKNVQFIVLVPDLKADQPERVFLASSADRWSEQGRPLDRIAPGVYAASLALPPGVLEYKLTRTASWATVEKARGGDELPNCAVTIDSKLDEQVVVHIVARWSDRPAPDQRRVELSPMPDAGPAASCPSTLTGDIRFHHLFHSPQLNNDRTIIVYLPPGYNTHADQRYPVLYMHDGNNVFDARTSFAGVEWAADETAERLIESGKIPPLIIVGIYNNADRMAEYTPFKDARNGGGNGDAYLAFIVETLKPFIDQTYRTRPERENTGIAGSSLGGLISLYAPYRYPNVFGRAAALSPTLPWGDGAVIGYVKEHKPPVAAKVWVDIDTPGPGQPAATPPGPETRLGREIARALEQAGGKADIDFHYEENPGGEHHEREWSKRFDKVLIFLFGS
jgi:predicted alpha/beta superfamily hydrolase